MVKKERNKDKIIASPSEEFDNIVMNLDDDIWWKWVRSWLSQETIIDIYENWDDKEKEEELVLLRSLLAK